MKQSLSYQRVAHAIAYLQSHAHEQPSLSDVANAIHISPYHLQRTFTQWAGISPKQFLQYLTLEHSKRLLAQQQTLQDISFEAGLSSASRLHDLFIKYEGMTPGEYKRQAAQLTIEFAFYDTIFGDCIIANTAKGICHIAFSDDSDDTLNTLHGCFPKAHLLEQRTALQASAAHVLNQPQNSLEAVKLHLIGTPFQLKVWRSLLSIPAGALCSYGALAQHISQPNAARAVGTAIASNPIAFLIPCHRVIRSTGEFGDYRWGAVRKRAIIAWESAQHQTGAYDE